MKSGGKVYYRNGLPMSEAEAAVSWEPVCSVSGGWTGTILEGRPVVFTGSTQEPFAASLQALARGEQGWEPLFSQKVAAMGGIGVCELNVGGRFALLLQPLPGALRVLEMDDARVVSNVRHGSGFPFPRGMMAMMFIPYGGMFLMPLVLAFILSAMMQSQRVTRYEGEAGSAPFASLARRAIAQVIDGGIVMLPMLIGWLSMISMFWDFERFMTSGGTGLMLTSFVLMFVGLGWSVVCFFVFSYLEGRWGRTPGKLATGIQVLGTDLTPCGFGRALVRNVLKMVDGFFNFMVGVLIVALSENWQRVGDMAARTIVVRVRGHETEDGRPTAWDRSDAADCCRTQ
jgi:uncharacterized RDD family membrane protein YckC